MVAAELVKKFIDGGESQEFLAGLEPNTNGENWTANGTNLVLQYQLRCMAVVARMRLAPRQYFMTLNAWADASIIEGKRLTLRYREEKIYEHTLDMSRLAIAMLCAADNGGTRYGYYLGHVDPKKHARRVTYFTLTPQSAWQALTNYLCTKVL